MAAPAHPCEEPYLPFDPQSYHWADVPPTFQYDGPADVLVGILYDPAYSSAMDLFRTLYPRREFSARALALTTHLATLNASSYSVWSYRADILIDGVDPALGNRAQRLAKELDWMEDMARGNMKSYQVWQHRRLILSALGDPSKELAFVTNVLDKDAKNYHTWAYRQWVLSQYGGLSSASAQRATHPSLWDGELDYIEKLFAEDVRNNSVWNHRFFVVFARGASDIDEEQRRKLVEKEVNFTKASLSSVPSNAAAWAYLRGVLLKAGNVPLSSYNLPIFVRNLVVPTNDASSSSPNSSSVLALEYLLDTAEEQIERGVSQEDVLKLVAPPQAAQAQSLQQFIDGTVSRLSVEDPIRRKWWAQRGVEICDFLTASV